MAKWIFAVLAVPVLSMCLSLLFSLSELRFDRQRALTPTSYGRRTISEDYKIVSLVALLATPERYEGQKVRVEGFLALEFEDTALHPDNDDWSAGLSSNALMVEVPPWATAETKKAVTRRYAAVAGTFTAKEGPQYGYGAGALKHIEQIDPTYTRADFRRMMTRNSGRALNQHFLSGWFLSAIGWTALALTWVMRRKT